MLTKFAIDYLAFPHHGTRVFTHLTEIRHEGAAMSGHKFDRMLKVAAGRIASELLRKSLSLDAGEIKDRFGFAA